MRIICKYSNVSFYSEGFNKLKITDEHPLMKVDVLTLLSRAGDWARGDLDDVERRLLFIALLKSTDRIEFRCPAIPTKATIERYMQTLIKVVGWKTKLGEQILELLPKYVIQRDNYLIPNIKHWLSRWEEEKKEWEQKGFLSSRRQKLELRTEALLRLIKSPARKVDSYSGILGRWALEASNAPPAMREYWLSLFRLKESKDIWTTSRVDLEELLEWMEDNLEASTPMGFTVFKHIRQLLTLNIGGMEASIGMFDDKRDFIDVTRSFKTTREQSPYFILRDSLGSDADSSLNEEKDPVQEENREMHIAKAPAEKPLEVAFLKRTDFIRALARWNLAQTAKKEQESFEKRQNELDIEAKKELNENFLDLETAFDEELEDIKGKLTNEGQASE